MFDLERVMPYAILTVAIHDAPRKRRGRGQSSSKLLHSALSSAQATEIRNKFKETTRS